jgi:3-phenylpropionate/trans-cinnamate dioxygenase ferredoxin component
MRCPVELAVADRVVAGQAAAVSIGASDIALFKVEGHIYALDDSCLRCGASLASGAVEGACVTCPRCSWRYYIPAGSVVGMPSLRVDMFEVSVVDGRFIVDTTPLAGD